MQTTTPEDSYFPMPVGLAYGTLKLQNTSWNNIVSVIE